MRFRTMLLLLLFLGAIIWFWVKPQERFRQMKAAGEKYNAQPKE